MSKIYHQSLIYRLSRKYILWVFKQYFSEVIVLGKENIPGHGEPVIYAANHLNALMDSLAILSLPPDNKPKVFLARADLFHLNPLIVRFLRFAKIMPAYRIRDGFENLEKNKDTFIEADKVLLNGACLGIMPEGNQGEQKRIRPLVKGIFRIAFSAQQKMPLGKNVKIVPVGLDMGDLIKFGKHLIIQIGTPINVGDYMDLFDKNQPKATNQIKEDLRISLEQLIPNLNTDTYYKTFQVAIEACKSSYLSKNKLKNDTINRFIAEKDLAKLLIKCEKFYPEKMVVLNETCKTLKHLLDISKLKLQNIEKPLPTNIKLFGFLIKAFLLNIISLPGYMLNILPFTLPYFVPGLLKIEFSGFISSVRYASSLITFPIFYSAQALILISIFNLPAWCFLLLLPIQYYWGRLALTTKNITSNLLEMIRLKIFHRTNNEKYQNLKHLQLQINKTLLTI